MAADTKSNVKKKQKSFIADNLDNNASVKEIVDFLHSKCKTKKVFGYYTQLLQRNTTDFNHFVYPGHPLVAFGDDWDGGLNSGYFESFTYRSLKPKMITPKIQNLNCQDPVTEIMVKKTNWNQQWARYKRQIAVLGKRKKTYEWLNDDMIHCLDHYRMIAEHSENDPDIYFDSCYNWHYAGNGNMHLLCFNGDNYLLHSELGTVYLSPFHKESLTIDYENEVKYDCGENTYILETTSSQNIIAVRTQYKVSIFKLVESDSKLEIQKLKDMESKFTFTGISFDEYHKNILYVVSLDYKLTIVNIDRMTGRSKQLKGRIETLTDNWSTVIGSERGYFTHVSKSSLTLYDKRTNNAFERWKNCKYITETAGCSNITVAKYRPKQPMLYIGTEHNIFLIDMRYSKSDNKKVEAVQRWTHGMECVPTYISLSEFEHNKELICLSSQWCEDMCVVSNDSDKMKPENIRNVTIPYRPPSIFATLLEAQEKMMCSDIYNPLQDRLCTTITGQMMLDQSDSYCILLQNSLGDISSHVLIPQNRMMFAEDDSVEHLQEWGKSYKREKKDFEVTHIVNIQNVWKKLQKVPDSYKIGENKFLYRKGCKFNEQEIYDTFEKEELDPGLLDIWIKDANGDSIAQTSQTVCDSD